MKKPVYINYIASWGIGFLCLFFLSCEEEFKVNMPDNVADGIVFRGLISNGPPPYFFHLNKPAAISAEKWHYEGIEDAEVVIEDVTAGIKDTLRLIVPRKGDGVFYLNYWNYRTQKEEEVMMSSQEWLRGHGIYVTTKIYGIEGHTYMLDIYYKGEHHTATEIMVPKTEITDLKVQSFDLGEGKTASWAPIISFVNQPEIDNYYLFHVDGHSSLTFPISSIYRLFRADEHWSYSILSDEHLGDSVVDLLVSDGEGVRNIAPGSHYPTIGDSVFITMESISKACYDIYDKAIEQLRTDGGAYTPTPTNVESNISGNVWGIFRVSAYSEKGIFIDRRH